MSGSSASASSSPPANTAAPAPRQQPTTTTATVAPFICIPLYIYPGPGAWDPLILAARARPSSHFHAIVNPHNGPGASPLPDANYVSALRALSALPNVTVLGYVHVTYGKRDAADVRRDVEAYGAWRGLDAGLRIDGIFFDEAPAERGMLGYMADVSRCAKRSLTAAAADLAAGDKEGIVMLNPGVVVPREYYDMADFVVAFEQAHGHWGSVGGEFLGAVDAAMRAKTVVMVHSCRVGDGDLERLARRFRGEGIRGQYVTAQMHGGYSEWPSWWDRYVEFVFPGSGVASGHA
ncbi:uncharacterized protein DNG_04084 [Cephalotrichum gorgonifer]|uniref:Spherulation-specific family 4 n=1 Tax=Cephalotrichum gorgonifer TaxID=2041049 RepID=A0AAE8SUV2_9PEZI|nr:uncharacterized protein DNG_04084 [Cephalotrichum gorgonifer]